MQNVSLPSIQIILKTSKPGLWIMDNGLWRADINRTCTLIPLEHTNPSVLLFPPSWCMAQFIWGSLHTCHSRFRARRKHSIRKLNTNPEFHTFFYLTFLKNKSWLTFVDEQLVEGFSPLERLFRRGPADESRTVLEQAHFCQVSHCVTHPKPCASLQPGVCVFLCIQVSLNASGGELPLWLTSEGRGRGGARASQ